MAITNNMPTFTYVRWTNMMISYDGNKYPIQNSYTDKMYLYWDMTSPYQLFCTDEKQKTTGNFFLVAVNEKGMATQMPNDNIVITYDGENPDIISEKIFGIYEKNEELGDKFVSIESDVNGLAQTVGTVKEEQSKVKEEVSQLKQTSERVEASVSKVEKEFNDNLETTALRENLNKSIIDLNSSLGVFKSYLSDVTRTSKIEQATLTEIETHLGLVASRKEKVILYVDKVLDLMEQGGFTDKFNALTSSKTKYVNALNNLDTVLKSVIADSVFLPSEITMITDLFGKANIATNELKNACDNCIYLGAGGATSEELARLSIKSDEIKFSVSKIETNMSNNLSVDQSHVQAQVSDVLMALGKLQASLTKVFEDGGVTESEKTVINDNYAGLTKEKEDMDVLYNTYYNDEFLSSSGKVLLNGAYTDFCSMHNNLKTKIEEVWEDTFVNEAEMSQVNLALTSYEVALNQLHRKLTDSIKDIDANKNNKQIKDTKDELQGNIDDVDKKLDNLDETVNTTFKDNVLDEAERKVIAQNVKTLEAEKQDVDTRYNHLYNNKFLEGNLKSDYKTAYDNFAEKYTSLMNTLNGILTKKDLISETDRTNMNNGYSGLNASLGVFSTLSSKVIENVALKEAEAVKQELATDIGEVGDRVTDLNKTMNGTFKDNVLDESERASIKLNLKNLNMQKNDIDNQYKQLYSNTSIDAKLKADLKAKYDLFLVKYNELVSVIQGILDKEALIDDTDRQRMNTAYEALDAPVADFIIVANKVIEDIAKKEADKVNTVIQDNIKDLNDRIDNIGGDIGGAIADGILDEAEKIAIKQNLKMLANDKENFHSQYMSLYENSNLVELAKAELKTAHDDYETAYDELVAKINEILEKTEKITEEDRTALDEAFANHSTKLGLFTSELSSALNSITNKGIDDAKQSLSKEMGELNLALTSLENTMNGVFKDGVLSDAEKIAIKQNLKNLETEKLDIDKRYLAVYNNDRLVGQVKTDLKTSYDNYILKYNNLVSVVNSIVNKEGILVESDQTTLNNAFTEHNTAIGNFSEKYSKAIDSITVKSIEDTKKDLQTEIGQVSNSVSTLETTMNGVFKDGVLSDSEKLAIKQNLQSLLNEKTDIDKQYDTLYANEDLTDPAKTNLRNAYDDYSTKYLSLVNTINTVVNKEGIVDSDDQRTLDTAFGNHRVALGVYSARVNEAIDAIVYKKAHTQANIVDKKWADIILKPETGIQATVGRLTETVNENNATINGLTEDVRVVKQDVSNIKIESDKIVQKVESVEKVATTVKNDVDNLQVGGRNLIVPKQMTSYAPYNITEVINDHDIKLVVKHENGYICLKRNDYTIKAGTYTLSGRATLNGQPIPKDFFKQKTLSSYNNTTAKITVNADGTFVATEEYNGTQSWILHCETQAIHTNDVIVFEYLKFEKGNRATDYTPSPELVDEMINSVQTGARNYLLKSSVYAWDGTDTTGNSNISNSGVLSIKTTASRANAYIWLLSTTSTGNKFSEKPDTRANEYTLSIDVKTNKGITANRASVEVAYWHGSDTVLSRRATLVESNGEWKRYSITLSTLSDIDVNKILLCFNVEAGSNITRLEYRNVSFTLGNKLADWTPAPEDIQDYIDNLEIGGRNLLTNSNFKKGLEGYVIANTSQGGTIEVVEFQGRKCVKFTNMGYWNVSKYFRTPNFQILKGQKAIFSADIYLTSGSYISVDYAGVLDRGDNHITVPSLNKWYRLSSPSTVEASADGSASLSLYAWGAEHKISGYITLLKVETGDKATGWSPAPEDIENTVQGLETRVQLAEQKVEKDRIVAVVKESQTNGRDTFVQGTEFEQTKNEFNFKFENTGTLNEVENSNFTGLLRRWTLLNPDNVRTFVERSLNYRGGDIMGTFAVHIEGCEDNKCVIYKQHIHPKNPMMTTFTLSACYHYEDVRPSSGDSYPMAYVYMEIWNEDGTVEYYNQAKLLDEGRTNVNWETVHNTWTREAKAIKEIYLAVYKRNTTGKMKITQIDMHEGDLHRKWVGCYNETKNNSTTIDNDGVKVVMNDGQGQQGYSRLSNEGITVHKPDGTVKAWFGQNDTAKIDSLEVSNRIKNPYVLQCNKGRQSEFWIGASPTGDGSGRDANNRANGINQFLQNLWNTYGCYSYKQDLILYIGAGSYYEDIYIGGWIGSGKLNVYFDSNAVLYGNILVEECTVKVNINGGRGAWDVNSGCIIYSPTENAIVVRNTVAHISGFRSKANSYPNYGKTFVRALDGARVLISNCDVVKFWHFAFSEHAFVHLADNRGDIQQIAGDSNNSTYYLLGTLRPLCASGVEFINCWNTWINQIGASQVNSLWIPKENVTPPPPPETWQWFEQTFSLTNLRSIPEGGGSATSERYGEMGQGSWGGYKAHRGFADIPQALRDFCSGARNISMTLGLTRLNTSHGNAGATPVPKLIQTDGSQFSVGVGFARGARHDVGIGDNLTWAFSTGNKNYLEIFSTTSSDYSFYNNVTLRVRCEKRV